ncbi:MAG: hypothetical protein LBB56_07080 [Chitinispirillales bacterium]|jgi:flagellar biosynthesis chaperone FliJ|nr:hypothetical protein [Chitinispirillales bacterium]
MKSTDYLQGLDEHRQEEINKLHQLDARYENGKIPKEEYDKQNNAINTTIDTLGKEIDEEIKNQGLSEQEYQEARDEWRQEQGQDRGR